MVNKRKNKKLDHYFEEILSKIQGHIYWKNLKSEYQWCNDLQAIDAGLKDRNEIIGMTDYDMPWQEDADFLRKMTQKSLRADQLLSLKKNQKQHLVKMLSGFLAKSLFLTRMVN
jgi:hypothetical protein